MFHGLEPTSALAVLVDCPNWMMFWNLSVEACIDDDLQWTEVLNAFVFAGAAFNLLVTDEDKENLGKIERHFNKMIPEVYGS